MLDDEHAKHQNVENICRQQNNKSRHSTRHVICRNAFLKNTANSKALGRQYVNQFI